MAATPIALKLRHWPGGFIGHAIQVDPRLDPHLADIALHTDDFTMSQRDVRMMNGTEFWIVAYVLLSNGRPVSDIDRYYRTMYGMSAEEFYQQNVVPHD
jgi:hypothetical protein